MRDIDEVMAQVRERDPEILVEQLRVKHAADDDGVWFFRKGEREIQLESSAGNLPFVIENSDNATCAYAHTIDGAVNEIIQFHR